MSPRRSGGLDLPVLAALGLGAILPLRGRPPVEPPVIHGRLHPLGPGKDTIDRPLGADGRRHAGRRCATYPEGFPDEVIDALRDATGRAGALQPPVQRAPT